MRIDTLEIKQFRCFEHYTIPLASRFNLLIGDNASGKSSILDALSVGAGSLFLGFPGVDTRHIKKDEIRRVTYVSGQTTTAEPQNDTSVKCIGVVDGTSIGWRRTLAGAERRTTRQYAKRVQAVAGQMADRVKANDPVTLPVLSYYGTGRLWKEKRARSASDTLSKGSRLRGYQDCFDPAADPKTMFRWFKTNELAAIQKGTRHVLEAVRGAVVACVEDAKRVWWDVDEDEIIVHLKRGNGEEEHIPFHLLSDGYRNMLAMVMDIAYRAATLNPQFEQSAVTETPGIVLIDEIDLHLHPTWQRRVIPDLLKAFPKFQFVATTHSPFMIQSLHGLEHVQLWEMNKQSSVPIESKSIEDIAEDKQNVELPQQSQRFLNMMQAARDYYAALRKSKQEGSKANSEEQVESLRQRLDELSMPYSDDPAFQAFLSMEREAAADSGV